MTYEQVGAKEVMKNLPEGMQEELKGLGAMDTYGYFGLSGQKELDWTLEQVGEELGTWEDFVRRHEPWFEDA